MFKRLDQHEILAPQTCTFLQRIENAQGETSRLQIYGMVIDEIVNIPSIHNISSINWKFNLFFLP